MKVSLRPEARGVRILCVNFLTTVEGCQPLGDFLSKLLEPDCSNLVVFFQ